jgi:D-alanyl-D-alanine carboxypeptidase
MKRFSIVLTLLLFVIGCGSSNQDSTGTNSPSTPTEQSFQNAVAESFQARGLPAVAAGLWEPGREPFIVLLGQSDLSTGRPVAADDKFRIGSVTKSFTVAVLLQLVDEGRVSLDDPIGDFVPGIHNPTATLEQMANMTSGVFNYTADTEFLTEFVEDFQRVWTEQELIQAAVRNSPYFAPGADWHYSNTNTVALGLVVEQITGNTLAQEIESRLLTPLGMNGTSYPDTDEMPVPFAVGYGLFEVEGELVDLTLSAPSASSGSGAIISCLDDLHKWGRAYGSGSLVSEATLARQLQFVSTDGCPDCPDYDGYGSGIGLLNGWRGHTGDYIGYQALVMYNPDTEQVAVILVNFKNFTSPGHVPTQMFRDFVSRL